MHMIPYDTTHMIPYDTTHMIPYDMTHMIPYDMMHNYLAQPINTPSRHQSGLCYSTCVTVYPIMKILLLLLLMTIILFYFCHVICLLDHLCNCLLRVLLHCVQCFVLYLCQFLVYIFASIPCRGWWFEFKVVEVQGV